MKTLLDLRNFLNNYSDEQLQKCPAVLVGEAESRTILMGEWEEDYFWHEDSYMIVPRSIIEENPEDYPDIDTKETNPTRFKGEPRLDEEF